MLDVDADGKSTPNVDRDAVRNPSPGMGGLYYQIELGRAARLSLKMIPKVKELIRYVKTADGPLVFVKTFYFIPLQREISPSDGDLCDLLTGDFHRSRR